MKNEQAEKHWYVVYSKPRWEKKVDTLLHQKGIDCWCPLQKTERQWSDRKKIVEEPIFRSYVFVHIDEVEKLDVLKTEGVLNFIHYLKKPAVVRNEEIESIKRYLNEGANLELIGNEELHKMDKVRIEEGIFQNALGTVVHANKKVAVIRIESLDMNILVSFPKKALQKLK
jgi:transcription antitermination factor NusG